MKILLLHEPSLPTSGVEVDLCELLCGLEGVEVRRASLAEFLGGKVSGEVFCNAHGEVYPVELEEWLFAFLRNGGGLLHLGGTPFEQPMRRCGDGWEPFCRTLDDALPHTQKGARDLPVNLFQARLGIHTYVPAGDHGEGAEGRWDYPSPLLPQSLPAEGPAPRRGLNVAPTVPIHVVRPDLVGRDHRAYMAKPLVRHTHLAGVWSDPVGRPLATAVCLTKAWGNPYTADQSRPQGPWALYGGTLTPRIAGELCGTMVRWLDCPCRLREVGLSRQSLRVGESSVARPAWIGELPAGWRVEARSASQTPSQWLAGEAPAWSDATDGAEGVELAMDESSLMKLVRFDLLDERGRLRDTARAAVTAWRPDWLKASAPALEPAGRYLSVRRGGTESGPRWLPGTNWQEPRRYAFTWQEPDVLQVACDARAMAEAGMVLVRPHYMLPGWFHQCAGNLFGEAFPQIYDAFPVGPELPETHLRALEAHVMLFGMAGMVFMPTLFTNVDSTTGNPSHWMNSARAYTVPGLIENQKLLCRQLRERFDGVPNISWDLLNEPNYDMERCASWLAELKPLLAGEAQTAGVGVFNRRDNLLLGEAADWHSIHKPGCKIGDDFRTGKPALAQEIWNPTPSDATGEADLERYLSRSIASALHHGAAGLMPWTWGKILAYWRYRTGFVEAWDHELGQAVNGDGTPRSGLGILRNWSCLLGRASFDLSLDRQVLYVYPRRTVDSGGSAEYLNMLAKRGITFAAVNDADFAEADLHETRLVIFPYCALGWREATWRRLQEYVRNGGVVWAHNDGLACDENGSCRPDRRIPLRSGLEILGAGRIHWFLGWNPGSRELFDRFEEMLDGLNLPAASPGQALRGGGRLVTRTRRSASETTMRSDWVPYDPLPECDVVTQVALLDEAGACLGGWSDGGVVFDLPGGRRLRGEGQVFFVVEDDGVYATGRSLTIAGGAGHPPGEAPLLDWSPRDGFTPVRQSVGIQACGQQGERTLRLSGWRQLYWAKIS
jgi:hypothetical protein